MEAVGRGTTIFKHEAQKQFLLFSLCFENQNLKFISTKPNFKAQLSLGISTSQTHKSYFSKSKKWESRN